MSNRPRIQKVQSDLEKDEKSLGHFLLYVYVITKENSTTWRFQPQLSYSQTPSTLHPYSSIFVTKSVY